MKKSTKVSILSLVMVSMSVGLVFAQEPGAPIGKLGPVDDRHLSNVMNKVNDVIDATNGHTTELKGLNNRFMGLQREQGAILNQVVTNGSEIEKLRATTGEELLSTNKRIALLQAESTTQKNNLSDLDRLVKESENELKATKDLTDKALTQAGDNKTSIEKLETKTKEIEETANAAKTEIATNKQDIATANKKINKSEEDIKTANDKTTKNENSIKSLTKEVGEVKATLEKADERSSDNKFAITQLKKNKADAGETKEALDQLTSNLHPNHQKKQIQN